MASINKHADWAEQPPAWVGVNRQNPLTRGLLFLHTPVARRDLVSGKFSPERATNYGLEPVPGGGLAHDVRMSVSGTYWERWTGLSQPESSDELTIMVTGHVKALNSNGQVIAFVSFAASTYLGQSNYTGGAGIRTNVYYYPNYNGNSDLGFGSSFFEAGKDYVLIMRYRRNVAHEVFLNGKLVLSAVPADFPANLLPGTDPTVTLGMRGDGENSSLSVTSSAIWLRYVRDDEVAKLTENSWQLFAPQVRRIWAVPTPTAPRAIIKRPWTSQPTKILDLDKSNPIASAFSVGFLPGVSRAGVGRYRAVFGDQPHPQVVIPSLGVVRSATVSSVSAKTQAFLPALTYPLKIVWVGRLLGTAPANYFALTNVSGPVAGSHYYLGGGSSSSVGGALRNNYSVTAWPGALVPGGVATGVDLVIVMQSLSATDHRLCVNGSSVGVDTTDIGPMVAWDAVEFGSSTGANDSQCAAALIGIGGRTLSDMEMVALSRSPLNVYRLFSAPVRRAWVPDEAVGGATHSADLLDALTALDSILPAALFTATAAEVAAALDSPGSLVNFLADFSDSVASGDASEAVAATLASMLETGAAAELLEALQNFFAQNPEALSAVEDPSASATVGAAVSETVASTEEPSVQLAAAAALAETASAAETVDAPGGAQSAAVVEVGSAADTPAAAAAFAAAVAEAGAVADTPAAAAAFNATAAEAGSAADTPAAAAAFAAAVAEAGSVADTPAASASSSQAVAEAGSAADTPAAAAAFAAAVAEAGAVADTQGVIAAFVAALAEAVSAAEQVSTGAIIPTALSEAVASSDTQSAINAAAAVAAEAGSVADTPAASASSSQAVAEAGSAADTPAAAAAFAAAAAEVGSTADTPAATAETSAALAETGSAADTPASTAASSSGDVAEAGSAADTPAVIAAFSATSTEAGALADAPAGSLVTATSLLETLSAADVAVVAGGIVAGAVAEALTASESSDASKDLVAALVETGAPVELLEAIGQYLSTLAESASALDSPGADAAFAAALLDTLTAAEIVQFIGALTTNPRYIRVAGARVYRAVARARNYKVSF